MAITRVETAINQDLLTKYQDQIIKDHNRFYGDGGDSFFNELKTSINTLVTIPKGTLYSYIDGPQGIFIATDDTWAGWNSAVFKFWGVCNSLTKELDYRGGYQINLARLTSEGLENNCQLCSSWIREINSKQIVKEFNKLEIIDVSKDILDKQLKNLEKQYEKDKNQVNNILKLIG